MPFNVCVMNNLSPEPVTDLFSYRVTPAYNLRSQTHDKFLFSIENILKNHYSILEH